MYALIHNEKVVQIEADTFPVAEPLVWVTCSDDVKAGWTYTDGKFVAPLVPQPKPKTVDDCISEGYARLAVLGWTPVRLDTLTKLENMLPAELQIKFTSNKEAVYGMFQTAIADPATFDASTFTVPHAPEEFGL